MNLSTRNPGWKQTQPSPLRKLYCTLSAAGYCLQGGFVPHCTCTRMSEAVSCLLSVCVLLVQYDAASIQPSVVLCSCASSSMVRTQLNSNLPHCLSMEVRGGEASIQPKASTIKPPQSRKKEDFSFGKILGEGSFSTVGTIFVLVA